MVLGQGSDPPSTLELPRAHQRRRPVSPDGDSETQACPVAPGEASPQIHPTAGPWGSGALSLANSARAQPGRGGFRSCPTSVRFCLWLPGGSRELPCEPWPSTLALLGWRNQSLWGESRLHRRRLSLVLGGGRRWAGTCGTVHAGASRLAACRNVWWRLHSLRAQHSQRGGGACGPRGPGCWHLASHLQLRVQPRVNALGHPGVCFTG